MHHGRVLLGCGVIYTVNKEGGFFWGNGSLSPREPASLFVAHACPDSTHTTCLLSSVTATCEFCHMEVTMVCHGLMRSTWVASGEEKCREYIPTMRRARYSFHIGLVMRSISFRIGITRWTCLLTHEDKTKQVRYFKTNPHWAWREILVAVETIVLPLPFWPVYGPNKMMIEVSRQPSIALFADFINQPAPRSSLQRPPKWSG